MPPRITWPPDSRSSSVPWSFKGLWVAGPYQGGDIVTDTGGAIWLALNDTLAADEPGTSPLWLSVTPPVVRGPRGHTGAPGVLAGGVGPAGAAGRLGARGARGDVGDVGATGADGAIPPPARLHWQPLLFLGEWLPNPTAPPQWALEANGTVWLRGGVEGPGGDETIIGAVPLGVAPPKHHWRTDFHVKGGVFVGAGQIVAKSADGSVKLDTSYRLDGDPIGDPGVDGAPAQGNILLGDSGWRAGNVTYSFRQGVMTVKVDATKPVDHTTTFQPLFDRPGDDGGVSVHDTRIQPVVARVPLPYPLLNLNYTAVGGQGSGGGVIVGSTGTIVYPDGAMTPELRIFNDVDLTALGYPYTQPTYPAWVVWHDCPYTEEDVSQVFNPGNTILSDLWQGQFSFSFEVETPTHA